MTATAKTLSFSEDLIREDRKALETTAEYRQNIQDILFHNQSKVLQAFIDENVGEHHFAGTTGYGFNDDGRETLGRVYARIFGTTAGIARHSIVSGTHALASALFGILRPGDTLLMATGDPYDTIKPILGINSLWRGGLNEWGISVKIVPLTPDDRPDIPAIVNAVDSTVKMVYLQRSCGYTWRKSFPVSLLGEITTAVKEKKKDTVILVDNCYGEMVEKLEPTDLGADIMGGSLIKNMGGTIAPSGGYVVGRKEYVDMASTALTCAGIGAEEGATLGNSRLLFQGSFMAPSIVAGALESAIWASCLLENLGFEVRPRYFEPRTDIIQAIKLGNRKKQEVFCRGIQKASPVDSRAVPEAGSLPGYRDPIIMAGGTFIQGSSIELSCDGPIREPHAVYLQGGISFAHARIGVMQAITEMNRNGLL